MEIEWKIKTLMQTFKVNFEMKTFILGKPLW